MIYSGFRSRLTCSDYERESIRRVKRVLLLFVYKTYVLQLISRYYKSSYTILVVNVSVIRLSLISRDYRHDSLYRTV
jgi:ABC-type iron transport system FetAB permease component